MTTEAPFAFARYRHPDDVDGHVLGAVPGHTPATLGLVVDDRIRPLSADELGAATLNHFLSDPDWQRVEALAAATDSGWRPLDSVVLTAPVEPRQVFQAGANYRDHVIELVAAGLTNNAGFTPENAHQKAAEMMDERAAHGEPYLFIGLPSCVVGPDEPLVLPASSKTHDWELELAAVIGRPAFQVTPDEALDYVAGYTICNDISTREFTFRTDMKDIGSDWFKSKNAPGFLPTGPFFVPAPYVDPTDVDLRLKLNGEIKQDANSSGLMFDLAALLSTASRTARLLPGDLLLTGSPAGNGQRWKRFLRDGDVLEGTIAGLGTQTVRCTAAAASGSEDSQK